jgi:hypothetical protein
MKSEIDKNNVQLRREVGEFGTELNKKIEALYKAKGYSKAQIQTLNFSKGNTNFLFDNLYENKLDYNSPKTLMTLKDPDKFPGDEEYLNEAERDFIRFFNEQVYHFTVKGFHTYTIEVEFRYDGITLKPKLTEEQGKSKRLLEVEKQHLSVIYCETLFASVFEMAEILERGFENDNRV